MPFLSKFFNSFLKVESTFEKESSKVGALMHGCMDGFMSDGCIEREKYDIWLICERNL